MGLLFSFMTWIVVHDDNEERDDEGEEEEEEKGMVLWFSCAGKRGLSDRDRFRVFLFSWVEEKQGLCLCLWWREDTEEDLFS